jgi:hypothetical protein
MEGLRDLHAAAETEAWRLEENRGELMGWIDLFPFSDDPESVHEALALLPERRRHPRALRRLLETLPQGPPGPALMALERLAADNPAFTQELEWKNALLTLDTEAAAPALLNHLCAAHISMADGHRLSGALTAGARKFPTVRAALVGRYDKLPPGKIRRVLETAMEDLGDEDVFMALFEARVAAAQPFDGLARAIRILALGRSPSDDWKGALEEVGRPLTGLRARLFAMLRADNVRARLAKECLIEIEYHRDDSGRVIGEPRHPDIATGRPWPPEADDSRVTGAS